MPKLLGGEALDYLLEHYLFQTVLDLGCGPGAQSEILKLAGKTVTSISLEKKYEDAIVGDYQQMSFGKPFDCIWCCHVLEHQCNVGFFLEKLFKDTRVGGVLAITVPPLATDLRDGHVSIWNPGLLLYNLILAGWDCSQAKIKQYGYNTSVIVERNKQKIEALSLDQAMQYFPEHCRNNLPKSESFNEM